MNPIKIANPIYVTRGAFGLAGTGVGLAGTVLRTSAHVLLSVLDQLGQVNEPGTSAEGNRSAGAASFVDDASMPGPTTAAAAAAAVTSVEGAPPGPTVVPVEPHVPEEPPIDVVGEALAAEAAAERGEAADGAGLAHEPRGASRNEEHGDAPSQRAETDEITEEAAAAREGDVEPEAHLTEPWLDPADATAVEAEMRATSKATDPNEG
ncbi:MAG TPA: hypothetical protein VFN05_12345 [Actinomycetes bacterium]|nr:hypothetical protein [Actinomycetes bacterium]